ncbi:hypothetical protein [Aeromicrobium sp. CTD01-1L150]|uniref:hypothetical protein n=1 Tax=Aeromicrobium sp. CTD01-1L150 TaxID=3341830 RepID=UPI0035C24371
MSRRARTLVLTAVVLALTGFTTPAVSMGSTADRGSTVTLCLVLSTPSEVEMTVPVPEPAVEKVLSATRSYRGPCADYGESAERGNGTMTAYSQAERGEPEAVGLVLETDVLDGLPHDPPTEGRWCYDKDGDGTVDPMTECAGGYEDALDLDADAVEEAGLPFTYVLNNWNPHGHMPPGVYDLPHFDVHFYTNPDEERLAIRPGPCEALVSCDDYELGKNLPAAKYLTEDHEDLDALEPAMGNHLIDLTGPEHHGERFTHAFIYGTWDGEVTFHEPMITHEWLQGLADGDQESGCEPIKQPGAWQADGWYPTSYCMRYRENRDELTVSLEDFVHRTAS